MKSIEHGRRDKSRQHIKITRCRLHERHNQELSKEDDCTAEGKMMAPANSG